MIITREQVPIAFSDKYIYQLPEGHKFPIEKYHLIKEQLLFENVVSNKVFIEPGLCDDQTIILSHDPKYWDKVKRFKLDKRSLRKIGLPLYDTSLKRVRNSVSGTVIIFNLVI
ncbi:MAG: hypothetical protein ABEH43_07665 [Flavobacteriales bacterium]